MVNEESGFDRRRDERSKANILEKLCDERQVLVDAFDVLPDGIAVFDAEDRFVMWNQRYAEIYDSIIGTIAVGVRFEDAVRAALAKGLIFDAVGGEEEWLAARLAEHNHASHSCEHHLQGDKWIRVDERRTPGGGKVSVRTDITELKRADAKIREQNQQLDAAVNNMVQGLVMFDAETRLVLVDQRYIEMYGLSSDFVKAGISNLQLLEHRKELGLFSGDPRARRQRHRARRAKGEPWSQVLETPDCRSIQIVHRPMPDGGWISTHEDITERQRLYRELEHRSTYDGLTGALNRAEFDKRLSVECKSADRHNRPLALLMVDVDFFKRINDTYGHQTGDRVLKDIVPLMREMARGGDVVARYGGEEFAIILPDTDEDGAMVIAARTRSNIENHSFEFSDHADINITVSIGCVSRQPLAITADDLFKAADAALYQAKDTGRNRVVSARGPLPDQ